MSTETFERILMVFMGLAILIALTGLAILLAVGYWSPVLVIFVVPVVGPARLIWRIATGQQTARLAQIDEQRRRTYILFFTFTVLIVLMTLSFGLMRLLRGP